MLRHFAIRRFWHFVLFAAILFIGPGGEVCAQVPAWPTPVPTATATPAPQPPTPTATPTPSPVPTEPEPSPNPEAEHEQAAPDNDAEEPVAENAAEDEDAIPEKGEEVNPGDVAFTDYQPFDLDEIEYERMQNKWKNFVAGLRGMARYNLFDGKLKFRLGGKIQADGTAGDGDETFDSNYFPIDSSFDLRRALLFAAGRVGQFNFSLGFEFGADWGIDKAWIEGSKGGLEVWGVYLGKLRVGLVSEPFSLERQTSAYNGGFLERSLPVQTIAPGSNVGAMVHDSGPNGKFTWAAGLFSFGQSNDNNASNSVLSLTGRATYRPFYREEGRRFFHVGLSLSSRSPSGGDTRYRSRPEARFVDYLVDTEPIETSHVSLFGAEVASVRGPLWIAAEYIQSRVGAQAAGDPIFQGSYVQVGWFLTGESRPYRANSGIFDRMRPHTKYRKGNPFRKRNGGAWEIVGRISRVDLNSGDIEGGELTDFSAALNWYLNATTRVSLNYVHARPEDRGAANIGLLRIQFQPW